MFLFTTDSLNLAKVLCEDDLSKLHDSITIAVLQFLHHILIKRKQEQSHEDCKLKLKMTLHMPFGSLMSPRI